MNTSKQQSRYELCRKYLIERGVPESDLNQPAIAAAMDTFGFAAYAIRHSMSEAVRAAKLSIYKRLIRYTFRKLNGLVRHKSEYPTGIPKHRDPRAECDSYWPSKLQRRYTSPVCDGDGHYLCNECAFKKGGDTSIERPNTNTTINY